MIGQTQHKCQISDPSGGAADRPPHLRYTISQASPALRWIAWRSSDRGGDPGGDPRVSRSIFWPDTPSLRELVASMAPPETQDPRSWITLRFGSQLLMDEPGSPPGICLSLGMLSLVVLIVIITGLVAVSVRLLPFHGLGCLRDLRDLRDPWWLWWLWWLWRYSTYLVAGFTRCSAADRTESGHDPRPIFSLVLTMVRSWCIYFLRYLPEHFAGITMLYRMISVSTWSLGAWTPGDIASAFRVFVWP